MRRMTDNFLLRLGGGAGLCKQLNMMEEKYRVSGEACGCVVRQCNSRTQQAKVVRFGNGWTACYGAYGPAGIRRQYGAQLPSL